MEGRNLIAFGLFVLLSPIGKVFSACDNDWEPYKDEKCVKLFDTAGLVSYEEAESFCKQKHDANLVSIDIEDKQTFLEEFLKPQGIAGYIWIGLKYQSDDNYIWSDDTDFDYNNWASDRPKNDSEYCVQMDTDDAEFGKWVDVLCTKKNLVLCEKVQPWSLSQLQNEFMALKKNVVPIGFIYVQLSKEKSPKKIWSWMKWKDVSSDYAGVFFRVEGGNSSSFGSIQEGTSPRLIESKEYSGESAYFTTHEIPADGKSHVAHCSLLPKDYKGFDCLNVTVSAEEVRPRNMAVRIWKRIH